MRRPAICRDCGKPCGGVHMRCWACYLAHRRANRKVYPPINTARYHMTHVLTQRVITGNGDYAPALYALIARYRPVGSALTLWDRIEKEAGL